MPTYGTGWYLPLIPTAALTLLLTGLTARSCGQGGNTPFIRWRDGTTHGPWRSVFDGQGRNGRDDGVISLRPAPPADPQDTHAGLVVSTAWYGDLDYTLSMRTAKTLRRPVANPWEVAWAVWAYTGPDHFYYLTLKPNGWELGKRDPAYAGGQRFLKTGEAGFPVGPWYRVRIRQRGPRLTVEAGGRRLTTFTDRERPYSGGAVGIYAEDAEAEFADFKIVSWWRAESVP